MALIDDRGRILGVVNVVDALVVLVAAAMVIAGVAIVAGGTRDTGEDDGPVRYGTLTYTVPGNGSGGELTAEETLSLRNGEGSLPVTDVYRSYGPGGSTRIAARFAHLVPPTVDGGRVYAGESVSVTWDDQWRNVTVERLNESDDVVPTSTVRVVLSASVPRSRDRLLEAGQRVRIGNETVATILDVDRTDGEYPRERLWIAAELRTRQVGAVPTFGSRAVLAGNRVTLVTEDAVVRGTVHDVGTSELPANVTTARP